MGWVKVDAPADTVSEKVEGLHVRMAEDVARAYRACGWAEDDREHVAVFAVDVKNRIKAVHLVSIGSMTSALVHPREVFRFAIHYGAASIVLAHHHPSGDPDPSSEDIELTRRIASVVEKPECKR
jgi:DNA repair protein RadC